MATIDPAGAASQALYTQPVQIQTTPQTAAAVTARPVVETNDTERPNDTVTQAASSESNLGQNIDTMA